MDSKTNTIQTNAFGKSQFCRRGGNFTNLSERMEDRPGDPVDYVVDKGLRAATGARTQPVSWFV